MLYVKIDGAGNISEMFDGFNEAPKADLVLVPDDIKKEILSNSHLWKYSNGKFIKKETTFSLDDAKSDKISELNNSCYQDICNGFISSAHGEEVFYGYSNTADQPDQQNLSELWAALKDGIVSTPVFYKGKGDVPLLGYTFDQYKQLVTDAANHKLSKQMRYYQLKEQVNNCTTVDDVSQISWG